MPNREDFDPAKAIREQQAAEKAEKNRIETARQRAQARAQAEEDLRRANIRNLLRYADEKLESLPDPIISELVVTEVWWKRQRKLISDPREPEGFQKALRPDQSVIGVERPGCFSISSRNKYQVATRQERVQDRYMGSWLLLYKRVEHGGYTPRSEYYNSFYGGLMKLRKPPNGYAFVESIGGLDLRNVSNDRHLNSCSRGQYVIDNYTKLGKFSVGELRNTPSVTERFWLIASLDEAFQKLESRVGRPSVEEVTKAVAHGLNFVETGEPSQLEETTFFREAT